MAAFSCYRPVYGVATLHQIQDSVVPQRHSALGCNVPLGELQSFSLLWVWEVPGCSRHQASLFWWQFVQLLVAAQDDDIVWCGSCRGHVQMWYCPSQLKSSLSNINLAVPSLPVLWSWTLIMPFNPSVSQVNCLQLVIGIISNGAKLLPALLQCCRRSDCAASIQQVC